MVSMGYEKQFEYNRQEHAAFWADINALKEAHKAAMARMERAEERMDRAEKRMDRFERGVRTIIVQGMKRIARLEQGQIELQQAVKAFLRARGNGGNGHRRS